jgi:hypothetical protein
LLKNGLTLTTTRAIVRQLVRERFDPEQRWRRAVLLDQMLYDVFRSLNRRYGVRFATLFCNSTAHFQHYYWRNWQPERFPVPPPATDSPSLREAVPYGYRCMDRLLGRILRDYPRATLMLCTALSQQPWIETTKCTYRPRKFDSLLAFARVSLPAEAVKPVMAEEFHLECSTPAQAEEVESCLGDLLVDGTPVMKVQRQGSSLFAGCRLTDPAVRDRTVVRRSDGAQQRFDELFYRIHTMRSGRHHPDGALWVRTGQHRRVRQKVPLTDIAPTILAHFNVPAPESMRGRPLPVGGRVPTHVTTNRSVTCALPSLRQERVA